MNGDPKDAGDDGDRKHKNNNTGSHKAKKKHRGTDEDSDEDDNDMRSLLLPQFDFSLDTFMTGAKRADHTAARML
jgi:hypothetical protein